MVESGLRVLAWTMLGWAHDDISVRVAPSKTAWCMITDAPSLLPRPSPRLRPHMLLRACSRAPERSGRSGRWAVGPLGRWAVGPLGRWDGHLGQDLPMRPVPPSPSAPAVTNPTAGGQKVPPLLADRHTAPGTAPQGVGCSDAEPAALRLPAVTSNRLFHT